MGEQSTAVAQAFASLRRFDLVLMQEQLQKPEVAHLLHAKLGWTVTEIPHANVHGSHSAPGQSEAGLVRGMNDLDSQLYSLVVDCQQFSFGTLTHCSDGM